MDMHGASSMEDFLFSKRCIGVVIVIALANLKFIVNRPSTTKTACVAMESIERVPRALLQTSEGYPPVPTLLVRFQRANIVTAKKICDGTEEKIEILKDQGFKFREIRRPDERPAGGLSI